MVMSDNITLYSQKILELTTQIPHQEPINGQSAKARSPICGSEITVTLRVEDGQIAAFSQDVRACALGQASAAIFGQAVIGRNPSEIAQLYDALKSFLEKQANPPSPPFEGYEILAPAQNYKHRHPAILLVVEASLQALNALNT